MQIGIFFLLTSKIQLLTSQLLKTHICHKKLQKQLQCNQGTASSQLAVTSQNFCYIENKLAATENDKQSGVNIKPFGQCRLKPIPGGFLPCVPAPVSWQNTTTKDEINGCKILLDSSSCPCSSGGEIRVTDKGHAGNHEAG